MVRKWEREKKNKTTRLRLISWSLSLSESPAFIFSLHPVSPPCLALRMTSSWTSRMFSSDPNGVRSSPGVRWVKSKCGLCYTDQNKVTRCMRFHLFVLWHPSMKAVNFKQLHVPDKDKLPRSMMPPPPPRFYILLRVMLTIIFPPQIDFYPNKLNTSLIWPRHLHLWACSKLHRGIHLTDFHQSPLTSVKKDQICGECG